MKKRKIFFNRVREILAEIHFYTNEVEALIKGIIWGLSWCAGILANQKITDMRALSSSYLMFALSLLMEFGLRIKGRKHWLSRIIYAIYCAALACIVIIATASLMGITFSQDYYKIMFEITKVIMIFMVIDIVIVWIEPNSEKINISKRENTNSINSNDLINDERNIFKEKLFIGYLGDIYNKGDDTNE